MSKEKLRLDLHFRGSMNEAMDLVQKVSGLAGLQNPKIIFATDQKRKDAVAQNDTLTVKGIYVSGVPIITNNYALKRLKDTFTLAEFEERMGSKWKPVIRAAVKPVMHVRFGS